MRTWIIKLSCELITPLQKARTFPRSQEEIKKDDSDFKFFANEINFFSWKQMVPGQTETVSPLRLNHFSTSQHSTIIVLPFDRNNRFWVDFARVQTIGFSFPHGLNQMVLCCFNTAAHDHRCSGSTFKEKQIIIRNENYCLFISGECCYLKYLLLLCYKYQEF